ncbi:MAG: M20/M25/M40 family metallo-hydrolase [Clostridiales Family XIII bacterium]|jgi:arginine utilization protein RocB|nr:M20/M25/M40 family metallo-hydrolase [Clostridiales Family XIII bacterium]
MISKDNVRNIMYDLVSVPSIAGTDAEDLGSVRLNELLAAMPYFQEHGELLRYIPIEDDYLRRHVVSAMVLAKKPTKQTIILTGHYDVVGLEEYGHLADIAFDIDALTKRISELDLDEDSQKDLDSNEWLFGRGTGDMKYGLALCLETLRYFTEEEDADVNLLFIGVPGEETNSEGMLRAVKEIYRLQAEEGYEFPLLINTEAYEPDVVDKGSHYIHMGCAGKLMPMFFFCGVGTHAGELAFRGFDANLMSSELHGLFHHDSAFCQTKMGRTTPPPSCLKMTDLKDSYTITTPNYAASYYNLITLDQDINVLMDGLKDVARRAFESAIAIDRARTEDYNKIAADKVPLQEIAVKISTFRELYDDVKSNYAGDFEADMRAYTRGLLEQGMEIQDIAMQLFKRLADLRKDKTPIIVIGFIPPYYPDGYPDGNDPRIAKIVSGIDHIIDYAREKYEAPIEVKNFYMGLSDMCFTGLSPDYDYDALFENIVGLGDFYQFPDRELKGINIPAIIFGPRSKDSHKSTERIDIPYSFDILPELFVHFISNYSEKLV